MSKPRTAEPRECGWGKAIAVAGIWFAVAATAFADPNVAFWLGAFALFATVAIY